MWPTSIFDPYPIPVDTIKGGSVTLMDYLDPDKARFQLFKDLPRDEPVNMLNLVKLHDVARYPDGTETTGQEAYGTYGLESGPVFKRLGGRIIWRGDFRLMLIGPENDENWDHCFIAGYPSAQAFIDMLKDPVYRQAVRHRQAAVKTSRLIRTCPDNTGDIFG